MSMAVFEYGYRFSVDEEIIDRYGCNISALSGPIVFETRIHYSVRGISRERKRIDWECFLTGCSPFGETQECLLLDIGRRLKDCWMPNPQIRTMIEQFVVFAKQTGGPTAPHGKVPVAVDVEVCTVQREGEEMALAVERAMKPAHLPPLRFYPNEGIGHSVFPAIFTRGYHDIVDLKAMSTVRVEDVEEASSVMDLCGICGRRPIIGTQILTLLCGHAFHLHCVAEPLLEESNSCPTCNHRPAFDEHPSFDTYYKFDHADFDPANPDRSVDDYESDYDDTGFWRIDDQSHLPSTVAAAETCWSQLLDDSDSESIDSDSDSATPDHSNAAAAAAGTFLSQHLDEDDDESDPDYDPAAPDTDSDLDD